MFILFAASVGANYYIIKSKMKTEAPAKYVTSNAPPAMNDFDDVEIGTDFGSAP